MRWAFWPAGILALLSGFFQPVHEKFFCAQEAARLLAPESTAIEERLLTLVNEERESRGLRPLLLSEGLAALARRHSADLAARGILSHVSSSGEPLQERLVRAGLFFEKAGENVARSETFVAGLIHQALMESSEHRENILDPAFDAVGIGAFEARDGAYFVTQDFVRAIEPLSPEAANARVVEKIQEWRSARSCPPLIFEEEANRIAQEFAEAKIADAEPPRKAGLRREMHLFTVITPALDDLDERAFHVDEPDYDEGGLGVCFGRTKSCPGGAYSVVVALYPKNKYLSLTDGERGEAIKSAVNAIREKRGLRSLKTDVHLAREAARLAGQISSEPRSVSLLSRGPRQMFVFSFRGNDIGQIPPEIEEALLAPDLAMIGAYALFVRSEGLPGGEYLVIGIVE
jgi:uncharacterized protein YkwD